jgi:hypothetical protein
MRRKEFDHALKHGFISHKFKSRPSQPCRLLACIPSYRLDHQRSLFAILDRRISLCQGMSFIILLLALLEYLTR